MSLEWGSLLAKGKLRSSVDDWLAKLYFVLLAAVWTTSIAAAHEHDTSLQGVCVIWGPRGGSINRLEPNRHRIVEAHPWIIATRQWLPAVLPRTSFRVCSKPRCLSFAN